MTGKVKTYFKKGFLMLLVTALVCSNSGISVLASVDAPADGTVPVIEVSENSVEEVQTEEPETEQPQAEVSQEETVAEVAEVSTWESLEFDRETEGENSTDVEYIYPEGSTSVSGINLNGNSVIIRASANDTNEKRLINIIIDKDKDGVIDDGEEPVEIDGSADLAGNISVYGYYNASEATKPISITMTGGKLSSVHGVYRSSLITSGETAVTMRMLGGEVSGVFYGVNESQVISTGAPAIEMYMDAEMTSSMSVLAAGVQSRIEVKDCAKTGVSVEMKNGKASTMNALLNCSYVSTGCSATALHVNVTGGTLNNIYAVQSGEVISDGTNPTLIDIDVDSMSLSNLYGIQAAKADAGKNTNKALDIDVTGVSKMSSDLYGVRGDSSSTTPITGDVEVDFTPDAGATSNNMYNIYAVNYCADVDGDVKLNVENASGSSASALYNNCSATGDVTLLIPEGSNLTNCVYGMYSSKCGGDLTLRVHGCDLSKTSAYLNIYGFKGRYKDQNNTVGGDFVFDYLGGRTYYIYVTEGYNSTPYGIIGGKAQINIASGNIETILGLYYTDVKGDVSFTIGDNAEDAKDCIVTSQITYSYYMNAKNVTSKTYLSNTESQKPYVYGWKYSTISGDYNFDMDGGYYYYVVGTESTNIQGNATVTVKNVSKEAQSISNGGYSHLLYYGSVGGNIDVTLEDSCFYALFAVDNISCGGTVTVDIENVDAYYNLYGASMKDTAGDITVTMTDVTGTYVYGVQQLGNFGGNVTATITRSSKNPSNSSSPVIYGFSGSSSCQTAKDVTITLNDCSGDYMYGISGGAIMGNLVVGINGGTYGSQTIGTSKYFASPSYVKGTSTITVSDATFYGNVSPYATSSDGKGSGDATVTIENCQFNAGPYTGEYFESTAAEDQKVTVTLDEDCSIADGIIIKAGGEKGEGTIQYDGETYVGGIVKITEDKQFEKYHLSGGSLYIPKGVTVEIDELYWEYGNVLLEGTLNANLKKDKNDSGKYINSIMYMNGGTTNLEVDAMEKVYWPFEVKYNAKGGTVLQSNSSTYRPITHPQGGNQLFVYVGQSIQYTVSAFEGYTLKSVTYTADEVVNNVPNSGALYTVTMPNAAVSFDVDFQGNQISVGKTMKDPVLKLNVATTVESPAYDLSTLSIANDAQAGSVTYEIDDTYGLPEGLSLVGDKIIGTPTVAYEEGKKTIIRVTGKNDTFVYLPFNFVVTTGNGIQTSQEGRITVDETNQIIYTNGNSVVIGIAENQTALYIDDDRDGVADFETPAVTGDYTNYTLYGLRNTDTKTPIRITMNDGTIGTICGAQNGAITAEGDGVQIYIYGGNVGSVYALDNASVTNTFRVMAYKEATVTSNNTVKNTCSYKGFLWQQELSDGTLSAASYGTYNFTEDLEADTIVLGGKHLIPEGVTLKSTKLTRVDGAEIRLRGTLLADSVPDNYYGKVFVQGGTLPENCTWDYVYYPVTTSTNIKNTKVTFSTSYSASVSLTEDGVSTTYLRAGYSVTTTVTEAPGYDYYYSVNDADMTQFTGTTFTFTAPRKITKVDVTYIPKQISIQKLFADPIGEVGKEYTATAPLYDLRGLTLVDDTTANFGGDVKYAMKSTSKLPAGLTFEDGRVIGTPTKADMTGTTVTFVLTGRNGTTETVDVVLKISGEELEERDINDLVEVSGATIDLQGTSVVVLEDPLNTNNSQIYIDDNQDGTADNNNPLLFGTATSANLSSYTLNGYTDLNNVYEGNITITVKGGNLKSLAGVRGTGSSENYWAKVNGTVTVNVGDVNMTDQTSAVYGICRGQATNVNLNVTDGYYLYTDIYGAYEGNVTENLSYTLAGDLYLEGNSSTVSNNKHVNMKAAEKTPVGGNVNIRWDIPDTSNFNSNFYQYSTFTGVYQKTVGGNVTCNMAGYCNTRNWRVLEGVTVTGDVELNLADGLYLDCYNTYSVMSDYPAVALGSKIGGDTAVNVAENGKITMYGLYVFHDTEGKSITVNVPVSAKQDISRLTLLTSVNTSNPEVTFVNQRGVVTVGGTGAYTIKKDLEASGITLNETVHVTVAEGVTVKTTSAKLVIASGAKLTNNGTLDAYMGVRGNTTGIGGMLINNGVLNTSAYTGRYYYDYYFPILATGCLINGEGATWNVAGTVYNLGKIVNYGTFNQTYASTYNYYLGTIYTTEPLTLSWDPATSSYYKSTNITNTSYPYPDFYYPITAEYPSHCLKGVTIGGDAVSASGVEGDTRQYVRAVHPSDSTPTFTVTPGEQLLDSVVISSVTYGPKDAIASDEENGTWLGCAQNIFEPLTVRVNFDAASEEISKITLDKDADRIENTTSEQPLVYGKKYYANAPLYDLTTLEVSGDTVEEGQVTYYLSSSSVLPNGLYFQNGKLYGTLTAATEEDQTITFIVKGRNQTSALFTLTLGPVAKAVPTFSAPTTLSGLIGETLADVSLPRNSMGTYSWKDTTVSLGNEVTTLEDQILYFTPADTANYDWAKAAENAGLTYADGKLTCKVDVSVCAGTPTYTVPETIKTTYGKTYGEVPIPAGDNDGRFEWYYASTTKVGNVGTYTRWVTYIPNDSNYQSVYYIEVQLIVEKAIPTYQKITSLSQECGSTLADILLPDAEGGKYQWITTATTIPLDGKTYQVGFKPDDTTNYDWTKIAGWDEAWKCVVFPIVVNLKHTYSTELAYDETYHWYPCLDETCDSVEGKEEHLWDDGFVLEEATTEEEGIIEYSCECGASYEEKIPKLTHATHVYTGAWKYDADGHWKQCTHAGCTETTEPEDHEFDEGVAVSAPTTSKKGVVKYTCEICKYTETEYLDEEEWENGGWSGDEDDEKEELVAGDEFEDPDTKAEYEVSKTGKEVVFLAPDKKTYTRFTIPKTVEFEGVYYKVTEIAPNAFKGNKKLKSVKIGSNIKTIGTRAFYGCSKLTTVTMGSNVTTIGNSAFQNCTSIKKFTIPSKVSKIGSKAFYGCKKLLSMTIKTTKLTEKKVGKSAFSKMGSSNYKKVKVKVPKKKLKTYKKMLVKRGLSKKAKVKK